MPTHVIYKILIQDTNICYKHMGAEEGILPKTELADGSTAVSSPILDTPAGDQCWSKHVVCICQ
jgi:hypothetical protein